jgi:hypothetical protein
MGTHGLFGITLEINGNQVTTTPLKEGIAVTFLRSDLLTNQESHKLNDLIAQLIKIQHELVERLDNGDCLLIGSNGQAYYLYDLRFGGTISILGINDICTAPPDAIINIIQTLDAVLQCCCQLPQWRNAGVLHFIPQHPVSVNKG